MRVSFFFRLVWHGGRREFPIPYIFIHTIYIYTHTIKAAYASRVTAENNDGLAKSGQRSLAALFQSNGLQEIIGLGRNP